MGARVTWGFALSGSCKALPSLLAKIIICNYVNAPGHVLKDKVIKLTRKALLQSRGRNRALLTAFDYVSFH